MPGALGYAPGPQYRYEQLEQQRRVLETDRPHALREAIYACRKGGTVFVLGVFVGLLDKFPMRALMNKGLALRGAIGTVRRYSAGRQNKRISQAWAEIFL